MPIRRVTPDDLADYKEWPKIEVCLSPEHNPPNNIFLTPGTYEWECPNCHQTKTFTTGIING